MVGSGNVFEDLGFSKAESAVLALKSDLLGKLRQLIADRGLTQREVAAILGQRQPRVSEIMRGQIHSITIDKLVDYLDRLGAEVEVDVRMRA